MEEFENMEHLLSKIKGETDKLRGSVDEIIKRLKEYRVALESDVNNTPGNQTKEWLRLFKSFFNV